MLQPFFPLINNSLSRFHLQELAGVLFIRSRSQAEDHPQLLLGRPQEEGHVLLEPQSILKNNSISFLLSERLRQVFGCGFSPRWAPVNSLRWNFHRKRPFSSQFLKIIKLGPKPQNRWSIKILGQSTKSSTGGKIIFLSKAYSAKQDIVHCFFVNPAQYAGWLHVIQKSLTRRWPATQTLSWSGIQSKEVPFSLFYNPWICSQTPSGEVDICISRPSGNNEESSSGSFVVLMNFTPIFHLPVLHRPC